MLRIALFLLIAVVSSAAVANESSMSASDGSDCPSANSAAREGESAASTEPTAPVRGERKLAPSIHGDLPTSRSQSTRWHSFLPGMFR